MTSRDVKDNFDFVHEIAAQLAARGTGHDVVVPSAALLGPAARAGRSIHTSDERLPGMGTVVKGPAFLWCSVEMPSCGPE